MTLMPGTEAEVADLVHEAAGRGRRLSIAGGATRSVGMQPDLSTAALTGIVDYQPAEMVMVVRAGTPLRHVQAALDAAGQMLPFEPMDHRQLLGTTGEPTIGGVFAANISGPRRFVAGAARDCLLGLRFVNGRGEVLRAGGRVMKNVTGLDLVKLLAGSRGTLGIITEVTFRVLPKPAFTRTLLVRGLTDADATQAMAKAMATSFDISGAAHLPQSIPATVGISSGEATLLRLEGRKSSVDSRFEGLVGVLGSQTQIESLDPNESETLWRSIGNAEVFAGDQRPVYRASVAPNAGYRLVESLSKTDAFEAFYDWQGGLVWMRLAEQPDGETVQQAVQAVGGGFAQSVREPARAPHRASSQPAVIALSAMIKSKLDPHGIFGEAA